MAELRTENMRIKDIALQLGMAVTALSPTRSKLVKKGMIYSPSHGVLSFSVPLFGNFMLRYISSIEDC